jgi:hypothetical protein
LPGKNRGIPVKSRPGFPVTVHRCVTRDAAYWERLAGMSPEEKILWADRTRDVVLALREAYGRCMESTR